MKTKYCSKTMTIVCPYCGLKNKHPFTMAPWAQMEIVECDLNSGGCEKRFVVDVQWEPKTTTKKIEGE